MLTNSNKFGKKLRINRILSMFLVFVMVLSMLPITNFTAFAASEVTVKVRFMNNHNWSNVYVYAGEGESWNLLTSKWPGEQLTKNSVGYYTYEVQKSTASSLNLVFNDGTDNNVNKTGDCTISASKLAEEKDGVLDVWIDGKSNVSYVAPDGGPTVNDGTVTFVYSNNSASQVYIAGTMNGWSTTANKMTKNSSSVFICSMQLKPGVYEYKFVVDGKWVADPTNTNILGETGNTVVIVPGLLDTTITVKKGSTITLPSKLQYISGDSEVQKSVNYTSLTDGVSVNGTIVTLADSFSKSQFDVQATTSEGEKATVTVKVYEQGDITVKIHYDRNDGAEKLWNVWVWSDNSGGKAYDFALVNGEYVATYTISAEDSPYVNSINYIIRKGEWVEQESTRTVDLSDVLSGTVHSYVKTDGTYSNDKSAATIGAKINSIDYNRGTNKIVVVSSGAIANPKSSFVIRKTDGTSIDISDVKISGTTYTLSINEDLTPLIKTCGTYKLIFDGNEYFVKMPNVYKTDEFETEYTYTGNDLGAVWSENSTVFRVWAPTAEVVKVQLYATGSDKEEGSRKLGVYSMQRDVKGTWTVTVNGDLNGVYYTYLTTVNGETQESCDPYAKTTGVNGERAMIIDLDSTDPEGWDEDISPNAGMSYTDAIIYELHIRDLSIDNESGVRDEWKGKFLGLTQKGTMNSAGIPTGLDHIKNLGVTHIHLLPSYDYASIDETMTEKDKEANPSKQFNWGYDPQNYNVPEGSYSTNPYDGSVRVAEMKEMVQTLHENSINVIMDVVYNHVYDAGTFCFNEIVPNYFSRTNEDGSYSNGSGCGNDTASERTMVRKYIVDSVKYWADEYHIDGFRFDLVGLLDAETINMVVNEVHKTHPDVIFYGEGWTMGTAVQPSDTIMATQQNAYATPNFAYFSDTFRDFIKGDNNAGTWGYVQGAREGDQEGTLMNCFTANTEWIENPTQVINYASCHDNYALMDKINVTKGSSSLENRVKMNNLAASIYMMAEGIPLIHAGEEMLRIKVDKQGNIIHNSYNSPDYINSLKWEDLESETYQKVTDYYKGLIEFRKNHAALRLTTKKEVNNNVESIYIDDNIVGFKINGKSKISEEVADEIAIFYNSNETSKSVSLYDLGFSSGTWKICVNDVAAGTEVLGSVTNGKVTIPAISALVLVKGETVDNDSVYTKNKVPEKGRVIVEYVDETGKILAKQELTGVIGDEYSASDKLIDGYVLKTTPDNVNGKFSSVDIIVTYIYTKQTVQKLNGLCKANDGQWYYYVDGKVDISFTGMAKNQYGWWYVKEGKLDLAYTGMATNSYGTWYMKKGKLDTTISGFYKTNLGWIYLTKGMLDVSYTGMAKNQYGWWYVKKGKLDLTYTGMATNAYGTWYMKKGKLDTSISGFYKTNLGWIYLTKGKLDVSYTGMAKNQYGWWYVKEGKLDLTYTGISENKYGMWYMTLGNLDKTYTGKATYKGETYEVVKGQVVNK